MNCSQPIANARPQLLDDRSPVATTNSSARCAHRWPSGRRCRIPIEPGSSFCPTHTVADQHRHDGDRSEVLLANSDSLHTAEGIHNSLAELYVLVAEDKIAPRRAAVLAYISHLMLRTLPALEQSTQIIFDLPRPRHDTPPDPNDTDDAEIPAALAHNAGPLADHQPRTTQPTNTPSTNQSDPPDPWDGYRPPKN